MVIYDCNDNFTYQYRIMRVNYMEISISLSYIYMNRIFRLTHSPKKLPGNLFNKRIKTLSIIKLISAKYWVHDYFIFNCQYIFELFVFQDGFNHIWCKISSTYFSIQFENIPHSRHPNIQNVCGCFTRKRMYKVHIELYIILTWNN